MMQQANPFDQFDAPAPAGNPFDSFVVGTPNPRIAAQERRAEEDQQFQRDQALRSEQRFQQQITREDRRDQRAADTASRAEVAASRLPGDKEKALREAISTVSSLGRASAGFNPDYLGFGSGLENTAQSYLNVGTPGQRDWWADFRGTDNLIRNELFGASLTAGEKQAYAATTITPDMAPEQARINIQRRQEIARSGLGRYRQYLLASGYGRDAIDALMGDALAEPAPRTQSEPERPNIGDIRFGDDVNDRPTGKRLTPEQERELQEFMTTKPSADALNGWFIGKGYGGLTPESAAAAAKAGRYGGVDYSRIDAPTAAEQAEINAQVQGADGAGAFAAGAGDTISMGLLDEAGSGLEAAFGSGTGSFADRYASRLRVNRGIQEGVRDDFTAPYVSGQVAGGVVLPAGGARGAVQLAKVGAAYGGAYGFGSSDGGAMDRLISAGAGAIGGAAGGYTFGRGGEMLADRIASRAMPTPGTPASRSQELIDAAERQRVQLTRPDFDPSRRNTYGFLETLPFAGGRIRDDLQRGVDQIEARAAEVGGGPGVPRATAGDAIRTAGERYIDRSRTVVNRLYDRAATLGGNAQVTPRQALATIDGHITELSQTPNANRTKLDLLNQVRGDLVDDAGNVRPLSIQAIRDLRTAMRDELGTKGLRFTDTERRVMQAIDSASTDIQAQLSGPALRAYQRADQAHRQRADLVDNVVERFIGGDRNARRSGEAIMAQVENAAAPRSGDAATLNRLMQRLEPGERQQVAATITAQLGRRGQDGDNAFSPNLFFSQIARYSPEARAAIFGDRGARDLADLAAIAEGRMGTLARLNNSRSGQAGNWFRAIQSVLGGGGAGAGVGAALSGVGAASAGATAGMVAAPLMLGGAYLSARALGNPRLVSTLASAARANTAQARQLVVRRLASLATREPALRTELLPIQHMLESTLRGSRAALAEEGEPGRERR